MNYLTLPEIQLVTFGDAFNFYAPYAKTELKSYKEILRLRNRYMPALCKRRLDSIRRHDIKQLHLDVGLNAGRTAANRMLEVICSVYNYALDSELYDGQNPASKIKKFKLRSRDRFLKAHEIDKFFAALEASRSRTVKDFIYMCIFTGARSGNVMAMRWKHLDFHERLWRIPDSKNGDPYVVPLIDQAIQILIDRFPYSQKSEFVFPSAYGYGHIKNPRKTWYGILERAGIEDLRVHDLRRSLGSWQAMTGANLSIIGKTLNHRSPQSTAIYARVDNGPVKEAMEVAVSAMLANRKTNECDAITVRNVEASAERRLRLITKEPDAVEMVNAMIVEKDPKDLAYEGNDEHDSGWELIL